MTQISLGFCSLGRAYAHAKNSPYHNETLGLSEIIQGILRREYESARDITEKVKIGGQLLRLQEEELDIKFKLNFPEEKQ